MTKPSRKILGLGALFLGGSIGIACGGGGETTDAAATGGTASGGTASGGAGTGAGTATGGASTGGGASGGAATGGVSNFEKNCMTPACATNAMLEDFEDNDDKLSAANGTTGYWYTYASDENGNPPIGVEITDISDAIADGMLSVAATGLSTGVKAGFGVEVNQVNTASCALDASAFAGLRVKIKGTTGTALQVTALVPDVVPPANGGSCADKCWDAHYKQKTFASDAFETWEIPWSDFEQQGWGTPVTFDPSLITKIQFSNSATGTGYDVQVDEVSFYGTGTGTCEGGGGAGGAAP